MLYSRKRTRAQHARLTLVADTAVKIPRARRALTLGLTWASAKRDGDLHRLIAMTIKSRPTRKKTPFLLTTHLPRVLEAMPQRRKMVRVRVRMRVVSRVVLVLVKVVVLVEVVVLVVLVVLVLSHQCRMSW